MANLFTVGHLLTVVVTLSIVTLCISLHYEVLLNSTRYLPKLTRRHRRRVLCLILIILVTHVAEIWLFAFGYYFLVEVRGLGVITGTELAGVADYAYYSAMVYTTVGFGDMIPTGPIRFMSGMEALTGLVMITWSASLTFLEMQREWSPRNDE
jgi:hypothetical protein